MDWKLYYEDGTTYSSDDGEWLAAYGAGVVGLGIPHADNGRQILSGEAYLLQDGHAEPQASDIFGVMAHLLNVDAMTVDQPLSDVQPVVMFQAGIKFGHNVDNDEWSRLWKWMVEDADTTWPARSGTRSPRER